MAHVTKCKFGEHTRRRRTFLEPLPCVTAMRKIVFLSNVYPRLPALMVCSGVHLEGTKPDPAATTIVFAPTVAGNRTLSRLTECIYAATFGGACCVV